MGSRVRSPPPRPPPSPGDKSSSAVMLDRLA